MMYGFEETYNQSIMTIRNLVEDIRFSRKLNLTSIKNSADKICQCSNTHNILRMFNNVNDKYPYMYSHPVDVAFISCIIGKWMHLEYTELSNLVCAGLMIDIGKAKIRDSILNKPDKLNRDELQVLRTHPTVGAHLLDKEYDFSIDVIEGILSHHERYDGSGYPNHLKGSEISLFGRILAIADVFDAMTSDKPYNLKQSPFKVVKEIEESSFDVLDPQICRIFIMNVVNFYPGCRVRLSNEKIGEIIYINPAEWSKPIIHCGDEYLNMSLIRNIEIEEMIS